MTAGVRGHGFGTLPVFLAGISTILGAIMFLRFGYAVGHVGLLGVVGIILLGHLVTIPTALALAEIATNRKVEGGGEYFIISRSFGTTIGGVIGISLYLSQAVSVAFYMIAFAEAFRPLSAWIEGRWGFALDLRIISIPALIGLLVPVLLRGAALGVRMLYIVAGVLLASLVMFFAGGPVEGYDAEAVTWVSRTESSDAFFVVFAIVFPAFTGMTAGVGLSGDLRNPRRSIPRGTLWATVTGMLVYVFIVVKLTYSAPPDALADNPLIMADIALWGPMILLGLACATISSAIGSVLVAPRTMQALAADKCFTVPFVNRWLSSGIGPANDPRNATLVTGAIALVVVYLGSVDLVARLISMFFMVTYGALCAISFLEHFAARPGYRPSFRSRWYLSLIGAVACLILMLQIDLPFALLALIVLVGLYQGMRRLRGGEGDLGAMFYGALTQLNRHINVRMQRGRHVASDDEWRPSVIMVNDRTFDRSSPQDLLRWLCYRHGFGTYLHFIRGRFNPKSAAESQRMRERLVEFAETSNSTVYMDTVVSPSMTSALAQCLQAPGVSGMPNNSVLFEFARRDPQVIVDDVVRHCRFAAGTDRTLLVLRHGNNHFGVRRTIHVWLTWNDAANANSMIMLSYILLDHPDWRKARIQVLVALPQAQVDPTREEFRRLVAEGRLPISEKSIEYIPTHDAVTLRELVAERSQAADLTVMGFDISGLKERGAEVFTGHESLRDVLFVHAPRRIAID